MINWIENYIISLVISVLLGSAIIPKILLIAYRRQLFDSNSKRHVHSGIVPRLGGISFLPALGLSFCIVIGINLRLGSPLMAQAIGQCALPLMFLICAMLLTYLVGMCDDLIGVRWSIKLLVQIIAGILIVTSGLWIHNLDGFLWIYQMPEWLGCLVTIFLVVFVMNAFNLIDGIDGLASGLSAVALLWYSWVFYNSGQYMYMVLAGATLGTLVPFFYYNVFGHAERHKKIFMGDTGSLTIGLMMVFFTIEVMNIDSAANFSNINVLIMALAPLIVPCFDVARVFLHRLRRGRSPFMPDTCHIHHKFLALGFHQSKTLIMILVADAIFIIANIVLSECVQPTWILLIDIALYSILNIVLTRMIRARERKCNIKLYD